MEQASVHTLYLRERVRKPLFNKRLLHCFDGYFPVLKTVSEFNVVSYQNRVKQDSIIYFANKRPIVA